MSNRCPMCCSTDIECRLVSEEVTWGGARGTIAIQIPVIDVPIHLCHSCKEEWYDPVGSKIQNEQIRAYLKEHYPERLNQKRRRRRNASAD